MRAANQFGYIIVVLVALLACKRENRPINKVEIGGEIAQDYIGFLTLQPQLTPFQVAQGEVPWVDTISIDTNWLFYKVLDIPEGRYWLGYGKELMPVFLTPGKTLNINIDAKNPVETLKFSAGTKKPSRYLRDKWYAKQEIDERKLYAYAEQDFLKSLDTARKRLDTILVDFITNKPTFNEAFFKRESMSNYYYVIAHRLNYAYKRHYYSDSLAPLSASYFDFVETFNFNDTSVFDEPDYVLAIQLIMDRDMESVYLHPEATQTTVFEAKTKWIDSLLVDEMKEYFLTSAAKNYIAYDFHSEPDSLIQYGLNSITDSLLVQSLLSELELRSHLVAGNPAPAIEAIDLEGNVQALASLKGRVVLLDFWATWCGPCIEQLPHLQKLERSFRGEPFTIVSVSIDDTRYKWSSWLTGHPSKLEQWWIKGGWSSQIVEDYVLVAIPRYVLIDAQGNIIEASAQQPSGNELNAQIQAALRAIS